MLYYDYEKLAPLMFMIWIDGEKQSVITCELEIQTVNLPMSSAVFAGIV